MRNSGVQGCSIHIKRCERRRALLLDVCGRDKDIVHLRAVVRSRLASLSPGSQTKDEELKRDADVTGCELDTRLQDALPNNLW